MGKKKNLGLVGSQQRSDAVWNEQYVPTLFPSKRASDETGEIQWMIERTLMELSMNRFQWTGLPKEVNKRWLEMSVNFYGLSVFFRDSTLNRYMALRGGPWGNLNMMGDPVKFKVYGTDMYQKELGIKECVPIWGNYMRYPDWDKIAIYARRIAQMDRTIEINSLNQRTPKILRTTQNTRLSVENIVRQIHEGNPAIELDISTMDPTDLVDVLDMGIDKDSILNMHIVRTREFQECLNLLGLNSSNQDKKERLTAAETSGNDDIIAAMRATFLQARQEACDQINDMFPEIALLPENQPDSIKDENLAEIQRQHPGVWVQYVTDMKNGKLAIDENGVGKDQQTPQEAQ
jgi:hypothetical protein